jgi:hypothetical protein
MFAKYPNFILSAPACVLQLGAARRGAVKGACADYALVYRNTKYYVPQEPENPYLQPAERLAAGAGWAS